MPGRAMVLAAGLGTRLRPLTDLLPKALMPVANQPLIAHVLRLLEHHGFRRVAVNLHHLPQAMTRELGDGSKWGVQITYSLEEQILGTGGGLVRMRDFLTAEGSFLVANGDVLCQPDLDNFEDFHHRSRAAATMLVRPMPAGGDYTPLGLDENGRLVNFKEVQVPARGRVRQVMFCGVHLLEPKVFDYLPTGGFSCVNDAAYTSMLKAGVAVMGYLYDGPWFDIGNPASYLEANLALVSGRAGLTGFDPFEGSELRGSVLWGAGATAEYGARVGPEVVLGPGVRVAAGATLTRSVVWQNCSVKESLDRAILADDRTVLRLS